MKHDFIADTRSLVMFPDPDGVHKISTIDQDGGSFPILETAHEQIAARLKIPRQYYDRMRTSQPKLLSANVNAWFEKEPERRMIRTLGGDARAFLSDRYNRIENEEIVGVVLPILADIPDVQIVSCELTEKRMYIQAVSPRVVGEVQKGDSVQAGVIISNSEIGMGSVSINAMDYRLRCLNGAISEKMLRAYHVGRKIEDNEALWADDTRKADDRAILLKVRDMVTAAVDAVRFRERIAVMTGLADQRVTGNPTVAVEVLAAKIGLNETETGGMLRSLIEGGDLSAWGLLNAVTAQAHTAKSYDRAVELETAGGSLLALPQSDWRKVLAAE